MNLVDAHNLTDAPGQRPTILTIFGQRVAPGASTKVESDRLKINRHRFARMEQEKMVAFGPKPDWYLRIKRSVATKSLRGFGNVERARAAARERQASLGSWEGDEETTSTEPELTPTPNYVEMKKDALKDLLEQRGLSSEGTKNELIERLVAADGAGGEEG